jgi:hypothetical protein
MKNTEINLNAMLTRTNNFGVAHAADFPATSKGGVLFASVTAGVPKVGSAAAAQVSGGEAARSGTDTKGVAFQWLHDDLMAIHKTAITLAQTTPGLDDKFHLPHNLTYGNVLPTARAFAADAAPLQADFVACEMPADFLAQLNNAITAFAGAADTQSGGKGARAKGTTGISSNLQTAFQAVRGLDAIVHNKYRNDPVTLAEWAAARHVQRTPRHTNPAPAPTPATTKP